MKEFEIIEAIVKELHRAKSKHPIFPVDRVHQVSIMMEEAGEAVRAANNFNLENGHISELATELIQTAAMCIRTLETISPSNIKHESTQATRSQENSTKQS